MKKNEKELVADKSIAPPEFNKVVVDEREFNIPKRTFKVLQNVNIFGKTQNYLKLVTEGHEPVFVQIGEKNYSTLKAQEDGATKEVSTEG